MKHVSDAQAETCMACVKAGFEFDISCAPFNSAKQVSNSRAAWMTDVVFEFRFIWHVTHFTASGQPCIW